MSGQLSTGIPEGRDDTGSQLLHSVFTHTMLVLGTELRSSVTITNCWAITLPHWCNSSDKNVLCHSKGSDYWLCTQSPKNFHFLHVAFIIKWWYLKIFLYFLSVLYNLHLYSSGFDVHIYSVGKYKFCVHMFMYDWIGLCVCLHMYISGDQWSMSSVSYHCYPPYFLRYYLKFPWLLSIQLGWLFKKI